MSEPLIFNHDGAVDEFMAMALLMTPDFTAAYDLQGVIVTNADCLGHEAVEVTRKIVKLAGLDIPVGLSSSRGVNPFPWIYRQYPLMLNPLPVLPQSDIPTQPADGDALFRELLQAAAPRSITLLVTCPFTTLSELLLADPGLAQGIKKIVWMGGALGGDEPKEWGSPGNIDPGIVPNPPPWSEWNAYWDPAAVAHVLGLGIEIVDFMLNVTNDFPIDSQWIIDNLDPHAATAPWCNLGANSYSMVVPQGGFCLWDVATTVYLTRPEFFAYESETLEIITEHGPDEARLVRSDCGSPVTVAKSKTDADGNSLSKDEVLRYVVEQWSA